MALKATQPTIEDLTPTYWHLVLADDPKKIARLEKLAGIDQVGAVNHFIENSWAWSEVVPNFVGGRGTPAKRLAALRAAYHAEKIDGIPLTPDQE